MFNCRTGYTFGLVDDFHKQLRGLLNIEQLVSESTITNAVNP